MGFFHDLIRDSRPRKPHPTSGLTPSSPVVGSALTQGEAEPGLEDSGSAKQAPSTVATERTQTFDSPAKTALKTAAIHQGNHEHGRASVPRESATLTPAPEMAHTAPQMANHRGTKGPGPQHSHKKRSHQNSKGEKTPDAVKITSNTLPAGQIFRDAKGRFTARSARDGRNSALASSSQSEPRGTRDSVYLSEQSKREITHPTSHPNPGERPLKGDGKIDPLSNRLNQKVQQPSLPTGEPPFTMAESANSSGAAPSTRTLPMEAPREIVHPIGVAMVEPTHAGDVSPAERAEMGVMNGMASPASTPSDKRRTTPKSGPRVYIGQVEVAVMAPNPPVQGSRNVRGDTGSRSRNYTKSILR